MSHNYTRQRQGRDFPNNRRKDAEEKKSLQNRLDYFKTVAEQNAAPVDGHEPEPERNASEKGRA